MNQCRLINGYGPTEYTVYSHTNEIKTSTNNYQIPIGYPIDNTKTYIVDKKLNLLPIGVIGEICISGAGIARGYINR